MEHEAEGVSVNPEGESHTTSTHEPKSREEKENIKRTWTQRQIEMRLVKRARRFKVPEGK